MKLFRLGKKQKKIFKLLFLIILFLFLKFLFYNNTSYYLTEAEINELRDLSYKVLQEDINNIEYSFVKRVIDGDTIELVNGQYVRYIGINTPELKDKRENLKFFAQKAYEVNKNLVLNKKVKLVKDVSQTDHYGRLLRYVFVDDIFVNLYLVKQGYAYAVSYPPDVKYQDLLKESQIKAKKEKRGLWGNSYINYN
jgi:micrococcal nuclease